MISCNNFSFEVRKSLHDHASLMFKVVQITPGTLCQFPDTMEENLLYDEEVFQLDLKSSASQEALGRNGRAAVQELSTRIPSENSVISFGKCPVESVFLRGRSNFLLVGRDLS